MVIAFIFIFLIVFFVLGAISKGKTGEAPSFRDLGIGTLSLLMLVGLLFLLFVMPILLTFS